MNAPSARRNDPCPCGSGRRFKECHGKLAPAGPASLEEAFARAMDAFHGRRPDSAAALFDAVLEIDREHPFATHFKGYALCQTGRFEEGMALLERAVAMQPLNPDFAGNKGIIHYVLGELPQAIESLRKAIGLAPAMAEPYSNLALALRDSGEPEAALDAVRHALALRPSMTVARANLAMILLALGRFEEAWAASNWRPNPAANLRDPALPDRWPHATGLPSFAADPWITIHGEQGLGDILFFLRFAAGLRSRGARIRYWGDSRLAPLLLRAGVVDEASSAADPPVANPAERLVWAGDLPGLLGARDEFPAPLALIPDEAKVRVLRDKLGQAGPAPYVALTWRAGLPRRGKAVLSKAIDPAALGSALKGVRATFISVQREPQGDETEALRTALGAAVHDFSGENADLEGALALMDLVDDYVGVSNTNMHLRAGTGKTARVLVPFPPEWRWTRAGDRSPWFPRFALYREAAPRDWGPALARLAADLRETRQ